MDRAIPPVRGTGLPKASRTVPITISRAPGLPVTPPTLTWYGSVDTPVTTRAVAVTVPEEATIRASPAWVK
jgi:hypothetical protein